jgi:hypothetical protein
MEKIAVGSGFLRSPAPVVLENLFVRYHIFAVQINKLVAVGSFGGKKALFPPGYFIPKAFGTPNMPHFDYKICLARPKNGNFSRSNPPTATSLMP